MKTLKKMMKLMMTLLMMLSPVGQAETLLEMKSFLKEELGTSAKISKENFPLSPEQQKALKAVAADSQDTAFAFYYGKSADGALEKACTALPQKGKEGPMTIGVCMGSTGIIKSVRILTYEEERGKPVAEQGFLKQFQGKKVSDAFQVGKDVDGVSGATYSSKAVSEAVRKAGYGFKTFVGK